MWEQHRQGREVGLIAGRAPFNPALPSLLLVHGSGGSAEIFLPQLSGLSGQVNVAAIDLPGHRDTPGPGRQRVEDYAAWLADFLAAGPLRPVVLGHSLGGAVCQMLALTRPELICGVMLACTGCRLKVLPAILEGLAADFLGTVKLVVRHAYGPAADPRTLELGVQAMAACAPEVVLGDFTACDNFDVCARLGEIRLPAWCLVGEHDQLTPAKYGQRLAEGIPGAGLTMIQGAGHTAHIEQPAAFNQAVLGFMARF